LSGLIYGLLPHIGCIGFIIFSVLGVTTATAIFRPLLLNPYFFHILIALAVFFATIAAAIYLKKNGIFSFQGIKKKKSYLLTLYGTTIGINLFLFMFVFPITANVDSGFSLTASLIGAFDGSEKLQLSGSGSLITLQVNIPCPGHAPLITGELKRINGVENIIFRFPNLFDVGYDPKQTSIEQIVSLDVFNTYKATVVEEKKIDYE